MLFEIKLQQDGARCNNQYIGGKDEVGSLNPPSSSRKRQPPRLGGCLFLPLRADSNVYRSRRGTAGCRCRGQMQAARSFRSGRKTGGRAKARPVFRAPQGGRLPSPVRTLGKTFVSFHVPRKRKENADKYCPAMQTSSFTRMRSVICMGLP